jgi:hypothetical protein
MALDPSDRLRSMLGEDIPDGGSAADTMFSDLEIADLLETFPENLERAAYEGWRVKAARLASLVDSTEGNSQHKFSQLRTNAEEMIKLYTRTSSGPTEGRTRVGRIVRPGVEW